MTTKQLVSRMWWTISVVVIVCMCFFAIRSWLPGGDGIVARATAADGTEICVVQSYNGTPAEPYTVSVYYRKPGQLWGWFYFDHQDTRWLSGKIVMDTNGTLARIYRGKTEEARFNSSTEQFTINRLSQTLGPAQEWMPADWKPEDLLGSKRPASRDTLQNSSSVNQ